jgi:hypothetical protein
MNDDTALREQLLAAEMSREMGEISDADFAELEVDLLGRIREIKERREGGSGPLAFGGTEPIGTSEESRFHVEASVSGDFYDPRDRPHTTVVDDPPPEGAFANLVQTDSEQSTEVLDLVPGDAAEPGMPALPLPASPGRTRAAARSAPAAARRTRAARRRRKARVG